MSNLNKTYNVTSTRQLVDLNGDSKNFDLTFTCTSKDRAPFEVLVVDQDTLDSTPTLQYKKAKGTISGNIVADKDKYQNYFLVLRSKSPCQVTVETQKKDIQPNLPPPRPMNTQTQPVQRTPSLQPPTRPNKSNWKTIALVIIVVGGGAFLYYLYSQKKDVSVPAPAPALAPAPAPPALSTLPVSSSPAVSGGLLDRLKSLDMSN